MKYKSIQKELAVIESTLSTLNLGERKNDIESTFKQLLLACSERNKDVLFKQAISLKCQLIKQRNTLRMAGCNENALHDVNTMIEGLQKYHDLAWEYFRTTLQAESLFNTLMSIGGVKILPVIFIISLIYILMGR